MGAPVTATELTAIDDVLRRQWVRLRRWVDDLDAAALSAPSVLDGWTVGHLLAHLVRSLSVLEVSQPTEPGTVPLPLAEYVAGYAPDAAAIASSTRDFADTIGDPRDRALDDAAERAFAQVTELRSTAPDPVVRARRGPILLSEMLVSRLVELVVHGDDLQRSTGRTDSPIDPDALRIVSDALLEVVVDRGGWSLEVVDELRWVRLAAGRSPYDTDELARALQPVHTAGSLPDLGRMLPVL